MTRLVVYQHADIATVSSPGHAVACAGSRT